MILPFVREALADLEHSPSFERVRRHLNLRSGRRRVSGLTATGRALYLPYFAKAAQTPVVVLVADNKAAETLEQMLRATYDSGGTLYLMLVLLLVALTVIIERTRYLSFMEKGGASLIAMLRKDGRNEEFALKGKLAQLPHARLFDVLQNEPANAHRDAFGGHLEEAIMHEVPVLDRSLWILDTVITLAPLLGLFGTIIGMFNAFHVLGDAQNGAAQVTGGIAEALIATASGLLIAIVGLVFFNALHTRVRIVLHQLETIKIMLVNRHDRMHGSNGSNGDGRGAVELVRNSARA